MQNIRVEVEDLTPVKKKLAISVPAETVKKEIDAAYRSIKSTANVAGFRKGSVPLNIIRARFGSHVQEDVTRKLIESTYPHALEEKKLMPVEAPNFELKTEKVSEDSDFAYTVTVEVQPTVEIGGYKGMELKKEEVTVTDEDIERGLNNLCKAAGEWVETDRSAEAGDMVVIDFEAFLGGEPIKNGKSSDYGCIIGEKALLPGFDESLKGARKGEKREFDVKFPENYSETSLAGKTGLFKTVVKAVKEKGTPEINDEFAKQLGLENVEALRAKVREEIEKHKQNDAKERLKTEILTKLIEKHRFEVPQALVDRYLRIILGRVVENMNAGVIAPEDKGLDIEKLKEKYTSAAIRSVREDIILDYISAKEQVDASSLEVEDAVRNIAAQRGVSYESLMARIEREGALQVIRDGLRHEKVFDIIIEASKPAQ